MKALFGSVVALLAVVCVVPTTSALSLQLYMESTSPVTTFDWSLNGSQIDIYETWTGPGRAFIMFDDLVQFQNYTVVKHITNNTGVDWNLFSNELLDPGPDAEDYQYDPQPYPGWVPDGFTTSNDYDGLSFAQGSGLPRTSSTFPDLLVDELGDARDFLQFSGGIVAGTGGFDLMTFGLRDNRPTGGENQPFLLAQRPNEYSIPPEIPEPSTVLLLGVAGLLGAAVHHRRRR